MVTTRSTRAAAAAADTEMADTAAPVKSEVAPREPKLVLSDLETAVVDAALAPTVKDARMEGRAVRTLMTIRSLLTPDIIIAFAKQCFGEAHTKFRDELVKAMKGIGGSEALDSLEAIALPSDGNAVAVSQAVSFVSLAAALVAIDLKKVDVALEITTSAVQNAQKVSAAGIRCYGAVFSRLLQYFALSHEYAKTLPSIRALLLGILRTATLRHEDLCEATALNILLRICILTQDYEQASRILSKTSYPEESHSNPQHARHLYYVGRVKAVQLEYSEAYTNLVQALRKAPQKGATGFRLAVTKLMVIVQLLIGDIPEKATFFAADLQDPLVPFFELAKAVRAGDMQQFESVLERHGNVLQFDATLYSLVLRLRQNVIRTGLRRICQSYARIPLADVREKLSLSSTDVTDADLECVVAKAIHDGVIDAVIDHSGQFIESKDVVDVYSTNEPTAAFSRRIQFCLNTYDEAAKAMRYPDNAAKRSRDDEEAERLVEEEEKEIMDAIDDDDVDDMF